MAPESLNITFRSNLSTETIDFSAAITISQSKVFLFLSFVIFFFNQITVEILGTSTLTTQSCTKFIFHLAGVQSNNKEIKLDFEQLEAQLEAYDFWKYDLAYDSWKN